MKIKSLYVVIAVFILASYSLVVFAEPDPLGPSDLKVGTPERRTADTDEGVLVQAQAGNVTSLSINSTAITKRWQGYYGNVTGIITLDDANNNTLYNWEFASIEGEIYAANYSSVSWSNIHCINFTADETSGRASKYNLSILNQFIGLGSDIEQASVDSVNATFNMTYADTGTGTDGESFKVGSVTIDNAANCSMANMFANSGWQSTSFHEVLLTDNTSIVFTALLEQDTTGFQNLPIDFEMIVGVNGTDSDTVRDYYFYIELS